jgi:hypothetical protein
MQALRDVAANYFYQAEPERHTLSAHRAAKPLRKVSQIIILFINC